MLVMSRIAGLALVAGIATVGSGCALVHARAPVPGPPLDAPAPPPRDIPAPSPVPVVAAPPPAVEPEAAAPDRQTPPRPPSEPVPVPAAAVPPAAPAGAPPPAPTLQTTPDVDAAIRRVRAVLDRASRDLGRVNYAGLRVEAKTQYDTARRFIQQADGALAERNVAYASQLADKAAALAEGIR